MASRRMFNIQLISKDVFRKLPAGTQLLYFHLCLSADDEGFVENAMSLIDILPVTFEDLRNLIERDYVIFLEDYLYIIKDWKIHNRITSQKFTGTQHVKYLKKVYVTENESYSINSGISLYDFEKQKGNLSKIITGNTLELEGLRDVTALDTEGKQDVNKPYTKNVQDVNNQYTEDIQNVAQLSKGKLSIEKESKVKVNAENNSIRSFLDSHNLTSLDDRFNFNLRDFFKTNNMNESDLLSYMDYVLRYSQAYHPNEAGYVDAKLFYANCFKKDILNRFKNQLNKIRTNTIHKPVCPVCGMEHDENGISDECSLNLNLPYSQEDIRTAKEKYEQTQKLVEQELNQAIKNMTNKFPLGGLK